jgi:hypothetical protein
MSKYFEFFKQIWDEREDPDGNCYCFETGRVLPGNIYRNNSCCYDHVLEKSKYKDLDFDKRNIVILHPDVHTLKTSNIDKCPKVKAYRDKLLSSIERQDLDDKEKLYE